MTLVKVVFAVCDDITSIMFSITHWQLEHVVHRANYLWTVELHCVSDAYCLRSNSKVQNQTSLMYLSILMVSKMKYFCAIIQYCWMSRSTWFQLWLHFTIMNIPAFKIQILPQWSVIISNVSIQQADDGRVDRSGSFPFGVLNHQQGNSPLISLPLVPTGGERRRP